MPTPIPRRGVTLGAFLLIAALAACSGGSVSTSPVATPQPSYIQTSSTSTTASTIVPATTVANISTLATLPSTNNGTSITETASTSSFASTGSLSIARVAQGERSVQAAAAPTAVVFLQFSAVTATTLNGSPALTFTLPTVATGVSYYLATYGVSGWIEPSAGRGIVSGSTVSFAASTASIAISPSAPLYIALYSIAASASPSPSPTASPSPSPAPVVAPASLMFDASQPTSAPFVVTETGYTGAFSATAACATAAPLDVRHVPLSIVTASPAPTSSPVPFVAQVSPASATAGPTGGATFTVTSGSYVGTCAITVSDAHNNSATVSVAVDETQATILSTHRATP